MTGRCKSPSQRSSKKLQKVTKGSKIVRLSSNKANKNNSNSLFFSIIMSYLSRTISIGDNWDIKSIGLLTVTVSFFIFMASFHIVEILLVYYKLFCIVIFGISLLIQLLIIKPSSYYMYPSDKTIQKYIIEYDKGNLSEEYIVARLKESLKTSDKEDVNGLNSRIVNNKGTLFSIATLMTAIGVVMCIFLVVLSNLL